MTAVTEKIDRADLHWALDAILDVADAEAGRLDVDAFWTFVSALAQGRGIADQVTEAAAAFAASHGGLPGGPAGAGAEAWRAAQWAYLFKVLQGLTAVPGAILPRDFAAAAFSAVAVNMLSGKAGGEHMDLLGLGTQRGGKQHAEDRAARRLLVGAVFYRAARTNKSVAATRRAMLPDDDIQDRTWQGWVREVAKAKNVPVKDAGADAKAAVRTGTASEVYDLDDERIRALLRTAWRPNS